MPSLIVTGQSGGHNLFSGYPISGRAIPVGGIQFLNDTVSSGSIYIGLSGNLTVQSGGFPLSGGGAFDGMRITPNASYFLPALACIGRGPNSGTLNAWAGIDPAASGFNRLYWEIL